MADAKISLEDRQALYDTLARYVWGMDTGDIEGVVAIFTSDGVVKDVTGKRWDAAAGGVRGFATHFLRRPHRRGGQHHVQHLFVEPAERGRYRVTSYWVSIQWDAEGDEKFIRAMGSYVDTCVKVAGRWRIQEKIIDPWNSATAPMVGHML
ncbi:MAG TPA: nuclear transport factor 2 family protein [Candidatus Tectomicrobia bacterium]|nr:nuclear transport factor 2 family protein [Candidatus Tectomicrobia bacterium]